jgi:hypothetical protein
LPAEPFDPAEPAERGAPPPGVQPKHSNQKASGPTRCVARRGVMLDASYPDLPGSGVASRQPQTHVMVIAAANAPGLVASTIVRISGPRPLIFR